MTAPSEPNPRPERIVRSRRAPDVHSATRTTGSTLARPISGPEADALHPAAHEPEAAPFPRDNRARDQMHEQVSWELRALPDGDLHTLAENLPMLAAHVNWRKH